MSGDFQHIKNMKANIFVTIFKNSILSQTLALFLCLMIVQESFSHFISKYHLHLSNFWMVDFKGYSNYSWINNSFHKPMIFHFIIFISISVFHIMAGVQQFEKAWWKQIWKNYNILERALNWAGFLRCYIAMWG